MIVDRPPFPRQFGPRDALPPPPIKYPPGPPMLLSVGPKTVSPGSTVVLDSTGLNTHSEGPFLLESVRLSTRWAVSSAQLGYGNPGGVLYVQLRAGGAYLTNGFCPWWLLGTQIQPRFVETVQDAWDWDAAAVNGETRYASFHWVLPRPLFVPHGSPILASVFRTGDAVTTYTGNHSIYISYAGRMLPPSTPTPPEVDIPWVTSFIGARGTSSINSGSNLQNPFLESPLFVQRMIGRLMISGPTGADLDDFWGDLGGMGVPTTQNFIYAKVRDSTGQDVVPQFMEWSTIFDRWRKAWTFNRTLDPREWLQLTTRPDAFGSGSSALTTVMASLVGFRREAIR